MTLAARIALHELQEHVSAMDVQSLTAEFHKFASGQRRMSKGGLAAFLAAQKMAHDDEIVADLMERIDQNQDGEVDLNEFIAVFKGSTELEMAFKSCNFERALALCFKFPAGTPESMLERFFELSDEQLDAAVSDAPQLITHILKGLIHKARGAKENQPAPGAAKYQGVFKGGTQDDFYDGIRKRTGDPAPDLEEGMRREHICMDEGTCTFSTNNYGVTTCPKTEFEGVVEMLMEGGAGFEKGEALTLDDGSKAERVVMKGTKRCRKNGQRQPDLRVLRPLPFYGDFKEDGWLVSRQECDSDTPVRKLVKKANLSRPEIVVIICYSGPLFVLYNGVLRGFGACGKVEEDEEFGSERFWEDINRVSVKDLMARSGHLFPSTIHLLVSAVKKLQMTAENGQGKMVFRGLPGLDLTDFKNSHGFSESGFLSTTSKIDVALEYSGVKQNLMATILAIPLAQIDNGADISFCSQYPSEKETLINACSFSEYQRGQDEIRMTKWGPVRVLHVKVNTNSRAQTREELEERRKNVVVNMLEEVAKDVRRELHARVDSDQFREKAGRDHCFRWYKVRLSVVLPPEQQLDDDAKKRFITCISKASIDDEHWLRLGKTEAVAAGTKVPVDVWCTGERELQKAAEGLTADKLKVALEAAGFEAADIEVPACLAGTVKTSTGSVKCTECRSETYYTATGATVCTECGAGTYSAAVSASATSTCIVCPSASTSVLRAQDAFVESIIEESEARVRVYKEMPAAWFTRSNGRLGKAVSDGLALPLLARAKFDLWLHGGPCGDSGDLRKGSSLTFGEAEGLSLAKRQEKLADVRAYAQQNADAEYYANVRLNGKETSRETVRERAMQGGVYFNWWDHLRELALQHCVFNRWIAGEEELDEKDEYTQLTPLFTYCLHGDNIIVQTLLEAGADAHAGNADGETPLTWALKEEKRELAVAIIEVLVLFKDLDALNAQTATCRNALEDTPGRTALHWAAYWGDVQMAKKLVAAGCNLDVLDTPSSEYDRPKTALDVAEGYCRNGGAKEQREEVARVIRAGRRSGGASSGAQGRQPYARMSEAYGRSVYQQGPLVAEPQYAYPQAQHPYAQQQYAMPQQQYGVHQPPIAPTPEINDVKGMCDVCRMPVFVSQARSKNQRGAYVHAQCVSGAGYKRVGVAGVSPPIAPTPEIQDVKGMCDVCRTPVFADQARGKNQRGAYVHAQCVHNVVQQPQQQYPVYQQQQQPPPPYGYPAYHAPHPQAPGP